MVTMIALYYEILRGPIVAVSSEGQQTMKISMPNIQMSHFSHFSHCIYNEHINSAW